MDTCPVVHFDQHSTDHATDPVSVYRQLREEAPVAWTESWGGFWIVSRYEDVFEAARDDETFSSRKDPNFEGVGFSGVSIPPSPSKGLPIELDPPVLDQHRKILSSFLSPVRARAMQPLYRAWTDWFIDQFIESGRTDIIEGVASPVPAMATLAFWGLPLEDWPLYAEPFHDIVAYPQGTPGFERAMVMQAECMDRVARELADRRVNPRADALTHLVQAEVDGVPLTEEETLATVRLILGGGIDTTTTLVAHSLVYLDEYPQHREGLLTEPKTMGWFCEEMLRFNSPTQALARTATRDTVLGGQEIKRGERVLLAWASANRDADAFYEPDEVVVDRMPNPHSAFGLGGHRCIGSHFARVEYSTMMERILTRLPDYRIEPGRRKYETIGIINGWRELPVSFTPGPVLGGPLITSYDEVPA